MSGWQRELSTPQERMSFIFLSPRLTDLTLTFHGSDTTLQVHKVVLAMSSPVFEKKLFCSDKVRERLVLPAEESPKAFKWLLKHLYCGTNKFQDYHQAVDIYTLAQKYEIESLVKLCKKYLEDTLNVVSLPSVYNLAVLHDDSHLLDTCVGFFLREYPNILSAPTFTRLSYRSLNHLLKQDLGLASHLHLFNALRAWGAAEMANTSLIEDLQKQVRWAIEDFLPSIDFLTFTVNEFVTHVLPTGVFTDEEFCTILTNIRSPNSWPMPEVITGGKIVHVGGNISCQQSQRNLGERYRNQLDEHYENQLDESYRNRLDGHYENGLNERVRKQVTVKVKWEVGTKRAALTSNRQRTLFSLSVLHTISVTMLRMNWKVKETDKLQTITVSGRRGKEVGSAIMDGNRAKFHDPLLLKPGVEYEVVLKKNNNGNHSPDDASEVCESSGINYGISESTSGLFGNILGSSGNTTRVPGNTTRVPGNTTGLSGNTTGLSGNTTGLPGNTFGTSGYFSNTSGTSGLFKNSTGISHPSGLFNYSDATGHLGDALGGKNLEPLEEEYTLYYRDNNDEE